jgi:hypothetical protein
MTKQTNDRWNRLTSCAVEELPTLATVLSMETAAGDEVVYFGQTPTYDEVIQTAGAVPVRVSGDLSMKAFDLASLVAVLTPRTRAIVLGNPDGFPGSAASRAMLATLAQLLTTARNIFGQPVYLITDESANIPCGDQPGAKKLVDFYPFTRISRMSTLAA